MDSDSNNESAVRRRRKLGSRAIRDPTPEPNFASLASRRQRSRADAEPPVTRNDAAADTGDVQTIRMQIRPPGSGTMSAHQSKILRRRDKSFADSASRSHSQPRQAERLSSPEASDLLRTVKRSLSSPRHKEDSSESELMSPTKTTPTRSFSPTNQHEAAAAAAAAKTRSRAATHASVSTADENLSRLELNLRRFEEERKRLEAEKRLFEREKREHKLRHRQMLDSEERKLLLQNYRKFGDRMPLPTDHEERRRLVNSLRPQNRNELQREPPLRTQRTARTARVYDESSTQFSSSDPDVEEALAKHLSPVRRQAKATTVQRAATPLPPERSSNSRNNSLSPIRPQRRSKTPEQRNSKAMRNASTNGELQRGHLSAPETKLNGDRSPPAEADSEFDDLRRRKIVRKEAPLQEAEVKRRQCIPPSLEVEEAKRSEDVMGEVTRVEQTPKNVDGTTGLKMTDQFTWREKIAAFFSRRTSEQKKMRTEKKAEKDEIPSEKHDHEVCEKILSWAFFRLFCADAQQEWRRLKSDYPNEWKEFRRLRRRCLAHTIILILLCGFGGLMFRYTEGTSENIYKCEVRKVKRDFIDSLWTVSHNMREDDWKSLARQKLRKFEEELHSLQILGVRYYPGQKSWNFVNCILYCWTVITTIGYGHITPKTTLGQSLTIIYAIIGIPMFLILLADFGKLFTRGMKFIWAYVRRLYYTGTCRQIRKQQQVRDAMSGFNTVYNMATRRPSYFFGMRDPAAGGAEEPDVESQAASEAGKSLGAISHPDTPTSPYPETYEVDDEFNLPVSVATSLLVAYILIGAFVYTMWEDWSYFEAFYFVFVSMSTIGFGDFVPNHPIFMMCSIIYLIFGLALTSMFINVVQIKLSDTFKQASAKIGATIGLGVPSEMGDELPPSMMMKTPSDIISVHGSRLDKIAENASESPASPMPPLTSILRPPRPVSPPNAAQEEVSGDEEPEMPPLLPRRQVSMEPQQSEAEKKKKKRFFK